MESVPGSSGKLPERIVKGLVTRHDPDLDGEPHGPQDLPGVHDPQELVLRGGLVEQSDLLVDKECVRNPDLLDVLSSNNELLQINLSIKSQPEKNIFSKSAKLLAPYVLCLTWDPSRIA